MGISHDHVDIVKLTCVWANLLASQLRGLPTQWEHFIHTSVCGDHEWQDLVLEDLGKCWSQCKGIVCGCPCMDLLRTYMCAHRQPVTRHVPYEWKCQPISVCLQSTYSQQGETSSQDQQSRDVNPFLYSSPPWLPPTQWSGVLDRGSGETVAEQTVPSLHSRSFMPRACPEMGRKRFWKR